MKFYSLWLSAICVVMFIFQQIFPGLTDALVLNQMSFFQVWRFISAIFLHASAAHLVFNLFALTLFGLILEKIIGSNKFAIIFFVSGIIANLIAVNFYSSSLGASGAIFGIIGALTILRPKMIIWVYAIPMPMFIAALVWIGAGIFGIFNPSGIGDIAHLSGIVVGFIFGGFYYSRFKERKEIKSGLNLPESEMRNWEELYVRK